MLSILKISASIYFILHILITIKIYRSEAVSLLYYNQRSSTTPHNYYSLYPTQNMRYQPLKMHRRFMWKDMDDTVENLYQGMFSGAKAIKTAIGTMLKPKSKRVIHYQPPVEYLLPETTTYVRYVYKQPVKHVRVIKLPKKVVTDVKPSPVPKIVEEDKSESPSNIIDDKEIQLSYMDKDKLRQLEREEERRVEATMSSYYSEQSTQYNSEEVVSGHIKAFDESWTPVTSYTPSGFTTSRPYVMSELHTSIAKEVESKSPSYEVTEQTGEESNNIPKTFNSKFMNGGAKTSARDYQSYYLRTHNKRENMSPRRSQTKIESKLTSSTSLPVSTTSLINVPISTMGSKVSTITYEPLTSLSNTQIKEESISPIKQRYKKIDALGKFKRLNGRGSVKFGERD